MHMLIICHEYGFVTINGSLALTQERFDKECGNPTITVMALYDNEGMQINAYAKPGTFKS